MYRAFEKTWRWFGRKDGITLDMLRQIGVEGVVTALHDVPNGEIWTEEDILSLEVHRRRRPALVRRGEPSGQRGDQICRSGA